MQYSDPDWGLARAFDLARLHRHALQVALPEDLTVEKRLAVAADGCAQVLLSIEAAGPMGPRLDRLLAAELGLSRSGLMALPDQGALHIVQGPRDALRMPLEGRSSCSSPWTASPQARAPGLLQALVGPPVANA